MPSPAQRHPPPVCDLDAYQLASRASESGGSSEIDVADLQRDFQALTLISSSVRALNLRDRSCLVLPLSVSLALRLSRALP
eukprot:SM000123S25864  [mRNA]  locus=s123:294946:295188:+ [translate_table: standard]